LLFFDGFLWPFAHTQLNTAANPKRESTARSIQPARDDDEITPGKQIKFNPRERSFPRGREKPLLYQKFSTRF
jgi:hypothetical protein